MGTEATKLTKVTNTTTQTGDLPRETVDGQSNSAFPVKIVKRRRVTDAQIKNANALMMQAWDMISQGAGADTEYRK